MATPPQRARDELTGRARVRLGFRRLVLQVEVNRLFSGPFDFRAPPAITGVKTFWRDATLEDLQALPGFRIGNPTEAENG